MPRLLEVSDLYKTYTPDRAVTRDRVAAVDGVSFAVQEGQLFTLLGPSGCGKTTTLRCIAGLEYPDRAEISLDGRVLFSSASRIRVPAHQRALGMVFQSYAIWPHLSVFKNVSFPLEVLPRSERPSRAEIRERVERLLTVVQLDVLAGRRATDLSGGQQQRLALARGLVLEPRLLLLDEPLSNLDARLREEMRAELKRLQRDLNVTSVYVTHDQVEAMAMSDVVAVMREGKLEQVGSPRDIYESPASSFVANFVGNANFIEGEVVSNEGASGMVVLRSLGGRLRARSARRLSVGAHAVVNIRPEHVLLKDLGASDGGLEWTGVVAGASFLGEALEYVVHTGELNIRVRTANTGPALSVGAPVAVNIPAEKCYIIAGSESGGHSLDSVEASAEF